MNLLLVDDEYYSVQGLREHLKELVPELDNIYTAYSAAQARQVYARERVDILVTDIAMPRENGLELIAWVRAEGYSSVNILLTGHEDFTYAREAIRLQCFRYVVKPIDMEELADTVRAAMKEVPEEENSVDEISQVLREATFFRSLFTGEIRPDDASIAEGMARLGIDEELLEHNFYFLLLKIGFRRGTILDAAMIPFKYEDLEKEVRESFHPVPCRLVGMGRDAYVLVFDAADTSALTREAFLDSEERVVTGLDGQYPDFRFVLYPSPMMPMASACYVYEMLQHYAASILTTDSNVVHLSDQELIPVKKMTEELPTEKWGGWLIQGRTEDIMRELHHILYRNERIFSVKRLTYMYYQILQLVFKAMTEQKMEMGEAMAGITAHADIAQTTSSIEHFEHWVERLLRNASELIRNASDSSSMLATVKKYIGDHLSDPDLGRTSIAASVHVTPDYLSYLFHKEAGQVLSSYISEARIEEAKRLLRTTEQPLHAVAVAVGFANDTYFHKQFKKLTGQTPAAYRTSHRR